MNSIAGLSLINGHWLPGKGKSWKRRSPASGQTVWTGHFSSAEQTATAIEAAQHAFADWSMTSLEDRMGFCRKFAEYVNQRCEELAHLIALENGKPLWEARTEAAAAIAKVDNSIDALQTRRWTTRQTLGDYSAVTRFRPHGVMFVIGPFNFPAHIPGGHIIPALLAGNTLVFKPSEWVPAVGQWLTKAWQASGLPPGVFNLVHGAEEVGQVATEHENVAGILFTGSQRVGTLLHRKLAGRPDKVLALEMGGNNPLVVHRTSDLRGAAITVILSAYITAGQRCTCTRRLIITRESYAPLVAELQALIPQIQVGLPFDEPQPFMGTLIHSESAQAMLAAQNQLIAEGAKPLVPMQAVERSEALVTPGLLEVQPGRQLEDRERFGPLLLVQPAEDLNQAVQLANATRYGLSAGFIGDHADDFHFFLDRSRAGIVNWNRQTTGASGKLPFGGIGRSGNHHPSGYFAADYCSYPIASLESSELTEARQPTPGLEFMDADRS